MPHELQAAGRARTTRVSARPGKWFKMPMRRTPRYPFGIMTAPFRVFDPLLPAAERRRHVASLRALRELPHLRRGRDRVRALRARDPAALRRGGELRADAAAASGGGSRRTCSPRAPTTSARPTRTSEPETPGIEPFLHFAGFVDAARALHGRPHVVPNIVYANLLLPGQELAVHTDVPEFRGANRKRYPQWLIVVMHHSGLFERWRMPIATGVAYFGACKGGEFAFYPDGPNGAPRDARREAQHRRAARHRHRLPRRRPRARRPCRCRRCARAPSCASIREPATGARAPSRASRSRTYRFGELRFSVSWKAYCFADEAERELVEAPRRRPRPRRHPRHARARPPRARRARRPAPEGRRLRAPADRHLHPLPRRLAWLRRCQAPS